MVEVKRCFLDKDRECGEDCTAYNTKNKSCNLLERSATLSGAFRVLMRWLGQHDPPQVR